MKGGETNGRIGRYSIPVIADVCIILLLVDPPAAKEAKSGSANAE